MKIKVMINSLMEPDSDPVLVCSVKMADAIAKGAWEVIEKKTISDPLDWETIKKVLDERS